MATVLIAYSWLIQRPRRPQRLDDLISVGKQLVQHRQYESACRLFRKLGALLPHKRNECTQLLVECLDRLDRFQDALAQCQLEIDRDRQSPLWYLMASDICIKRKDYQQAVQWLERGLAAISPLSFEAPVFSQQLQFASAGVASQPAKSFAAPLAACDFVERLPYDVTCTIFQSLHLRDLLECMRVSHHWHHYISHSVHLWQDLEFGQHKKKPVNMVAFQTYLKRLRGAQLRCLRIHHERIYGDAIIETLTMFDCYRLQVLDVSELICRPSLFLRLLEGAGPTLKVLRWGGLTIKLNDLVAHVARVCPRLVELTVHDCFASTVNDRTQSSDLQWLTSDFFSTSDLPILTIQKLSLSNIHGFSTRHLAQLLWQCPKLHSLWLNHCLVHSISVFYLLQYCCPHLRELSYHRHRCDQPAVPPLVHHRLLKILETDRPVSPPKPPQMYTTIRFQKANDLSALAIQHMLQKAHATLECLDLEQCAHLTSDALVSPSGRSSPVTQPLWPKLRTLRLENCPQLTEAGLTQLVSGCPALRQLSFAGNPDAVTDAVLEAMETACVYLEDVSIAGCVRVTDKAIRRFVYARRSRLITFDVEGTQVGTETLGILLANLP